jgi:hypothetical protein
MGETCVYDGQEVVRTGRTAVRTLRVTLSGTPREETVFEITPLDSYGEPPWKKWVPDSELYKIQS